MVHRVLMANEVVAETRTSTKVFGV